MARMIVGAKWVVTGIRDRHTPDIKTDAGVLSRDGVIEAIGSLSTLRELAPDADITTFSNHVMLPGFVNSHHHVGLTPVQVGSPDLALELWLAYRSFERRPNPYVDTLFSAFEMLASGVTTVAHINGPIPGGPEEAYATATQLLKAYRDIGMRSSFSVMARDQNRLVYEADDVFCARLPSALGTKLSQELSKQSISIGESIELFDHLVQENQGQRLTRIQLAPANLHWCSDDALLALAEKARSAKVPMHMHLLETIYQKEYGRRRSQGKTAVRHLHDLGVLGPDMTLGHGVWLSEEDIEIAAHAGTCICHNCSSNFRLRSGVAPLNMFEARNVTTAIGIDEAGINDDRDMLQEMRMVLKAHRTPGLDENEVPTVPQVLRMATEGGAKTTAFGDSIGRLEPSRFFDAVIVDWEEATFPYQDDAIPALDALVQRAKASAVKVVYVDGRVVYRDGRFTNIDRDEIIREIARQMAAPASPEQLAQRELVNDILPFVRDFYRSYLPDETPEPFYRYSARR